MKLDVQYVQKPWGRTQLPEMFRRTGGQRIGEVWFDGGGDLPLLAKYLFTSERLSVQVHPDDSQARARGLPRGKSECWYVLDAEPGAMIGLGLRCGVGADELRSASLDGSVIDLMEWHPTHPGDFFYVPAGTIHAIGGGLSLLEFQQNSDVTYRLYDYGRPRELHLDDAVAVAERAPYSNQMSGRADPHDDRVLVDGPVFMLVHTHSDRLAHRQRWVLPLEGRVHCGDETAIPGECLLLDPGERLEVEQARILIGAAV